MIRAEAQNRLEPRALAAYAYTQLDAVARLPRRIATVVDHLESGTIKVGVVPSGLEATEHMLRSVANRVGAALIIVGLLVASALMANVSHWISGVGFISAFVLGALHALEDHPDARRALSSEERLPAPRSVVERQAETKGGSMGGNGYAKDVLVTTDWLAEHLDDSNVVVAEVDENPALYDEGHVRGAVRLHWREDLQDPVERDLIGRDAFEKLMGGLGISNDTTVVLYGDRNNWFAAYAYWYLKIYGHEDVRIVDGGRQKWVDENRELTQRRAVARRRRRTRPASATRRSGRSATTCSPALGDGVAPARRRAEPAGVLGRSDRASRLRAGGRATRRAHPAARSRSRGRRPCATTERSRARTS